MTREPRQDEHDEHDEHESSGYGDDGPAPVITDDGVYGRLPRRSMTLGEYRERERRDRARSGGLATGIPAIVLTLSAALWLMVYSAAQATSETVAVPAIARGIDSLTGLPDLLAFHEEEIRRAAALAPGADQPIAVPGFEVAGVSLTRAEIEDGSPEEWHRLLRERAARAVYAGDVSVLSSSGAATDEGVFSTSGGVRLFMDSLSESNHSLAATLMPVGVIAVVAAGAVLLLGRDTRRFQVVGTALAIAALAPIGAALVGRLGIAVLGGSSALADDLHSIGSEITGIPLRNGLTVLIAGLAIAVAARLLRRLAEARPESAADEDADAYAPG